MRNISKKSRIVAILVAVLAGALILTAKTSNASAKGIVTFTFDDGESSQYNVAYPILRQYNFPATAYITTDWIGIPNPKFMNWNQVKALQDEGNWEIGNHTANHDELWRKKFSKRYIRRDLERSQNILVAHGIVRPVSFAPPYGKWNNRLMKIVRQWGFTSSRRAWVKKSPLNDPHSRKFNRWAFEAVGLARPRTFEDVQRYINWAAENDEWLVFVIHGVSETPRGNETSATELRKIAQYVSDLENKGEINVLTVKDAFAGF